MTVAESVMNLAVVGARPLALVNCLNFGNPEHPEVMWQLSEAVDGMTEALDAFGVPCVGGNVSLYNESRGRDIDPTPVVGLLGMVDRLDRRPPGVRLVDGGRLVLVGETRARAVRLAVGGRPWSPGPWRAADRRPGRGRGRGGRRCASWSAAGLVLGAHDVARGGVALALAEMAVRSGVGFTAARRRTTRAVLGVVGPCGAVRRRRAAAGGARRARGRARCPTVASASPAATAWSRSRT